MPALSLEKPLRGPKREPQVTEEFGPRKESVWGCMPKGFVTSTEHPSW